MVKFLDKEVGPIGFGLMGKWQFSKLISHQVIQELIGLKASLGAPTLPHWSRLSPQ